MHDPETRALAEHLVGELADLEYQGSQALAHGERYEGADDDRAAAYDRKRAQLRSLGYDVTAAGCGPLTLVERPGPPSRALAPQLPPLAARPFSQLARRCWRLRIDVPRGYMLGISGAAWYRPRRRRPAVAASRPVLRAAARRRANRAYWRARPLYLCPVAGELAIGLGVDPFVVYGSCEVA